MEILKSPNPRNRNSISVIKSIFLSVSSMNTLLAILKVTDARRDVILGGGLYHRFPWRHLPSPLPVAILMLFSAMVKTSLSHTFHWSVLTCRGIHPPPPPLYFRGLSMTSFSHNFVGHKRYPFGLLVRLKI